MHTSFSPKDFGTGRWEGGAATITNPHFEYRDADFGRGPEKLVTCALVYMDRDGGEHPARFDVGNTQTSMGEAILVVRASADDDAEEAETGPSFSHIDRDRVYKVSSRSEFGMLMTALMACGVSESKLSSGDIGVIDGLEVIVTPKAKREGDRFPLLLPTELVTKKTAKPAAANAASKPVAPKATASPLGADDVVAEARDFVLELMAESGNGSGEAAPVRLGKAVTQATVRFKGDKRKSADVVRLLQEPDFHSQHADLWSYDTRAKMISPIT